MSLQQQFSNLPERPTLASIPLYCDPKRTSEMPLAQMENHSDLLAMGANAPGLGWQYCTAILSPAASQ